MDGDTCFRRILPDGKIFIREKTLQRVVSERVVEARRARPSRPLSAARDFPREPRVEPRKTTQAFRPRTTSTAARASRLPRNAALEISEASVFFERRLSDKSMCDPPTRPKPPSLLYGGRYSAEANAARAERWRALAALQTRGAETAGRKAHASDATDAASVAACDALEARETELGTHDANATRSSQVVVPTPTPELESESATWAKRVPWSRVNVVRQDTERVADGGDSKRDETEKGVPEEDASGLVATSVDFPTDQFVTPPVPCTSPLVTARVSGCLADEVVVGGFAASRRRLFRLDSGEDDAPRGSAPEEELLSPSASPSGFATCSFVTAGAETDDWDALGVVHHEAIVWNDTNNATDTESEKSGSSSSGWNPSSDATVSSGWTERETFSERSSSSRDEEQETFPRSALFSPLPRACSRAFREAVEAVEREDERRTREAERFVAERLVKKDERDGSRAKLADAENVDPETVARSSHPATARAAAAGGADAAATREKNAAAFAALRRSLELNSPRAPPPVRTRVAPRETKKKKPLASRSSVSVPAEKVPRPSSSSRDAKRRRDEKEKTSWEPEKTWPPLPAAEPDETAVAEEEAEAPTASGGVAKLEDEKDATKTNDAKQKQTHECVSAASSSSVWAAIVAADSDAAKTTEVFELVADTRNDKAASPIGRAEAETLSKEVFEETAPAVFAADAREGAKSPLLEDDDAEATRRRCEAAVAALEDAVRLALDARAAAAACAPNAAAEMDKKMADAARALSDRTRETNGLSDFSPSARFFSFDAEECFAPTWPCVFVSGGTEKEQVPRVCRWRSAHGSSFALGPAGNDPGADPAFDSIDSESRLERLMERAVERCLAKFGDGIVRAVRASSQASSP